MRTRLYLRASTSDQDATRAQAQLEAFAVERGLDVVGTYTENESGNRLDRPELFRLLRDSRAGDVLLIEQVDRLSRLDEKDWKRLRAEIDTNGVRVVALDLPTSWSMTSDDEFTARMLGTINGMLLDMLAAIARKDYTDRKRRQAQGLAKAKAEGRLTGRVADEKRNTSIRAMLAKGLSWSQVQDATGCSRAHLAKLVKYDRQPA